MRHQHDLRFAQLTAIVENSLAHRVYVAWRIEGEDIMIARTQAGYVAQAALPNATIARFTTPPAASLARCMSYIPASLLAKIMATSQVAPSPLVRRFQVVCNG